MVYQFLPFLTILEQCSVSNFTYNVRPMKLGVEVFGIDLKENISREIVEIIKQDLWRHRLLVFRDQGKVSPDRQIEIGKWFGNIDSEYIPRHPMSPSLQISRLSNSASQGHRYAGHGWHMDGTFRDVPYSVNVFYMVSIPRRGDTRFVGLREVLQSLSSGERQKWDKLWIFSSTARVKNSKYVKIQPFVYKHPVTKEPISRFISDLKTENETLLTVSDTKKVLQRLRDAITRDNERFIYSHKWKEGDLIIIDNLAVAHEATPECHLHVSKVGLRILHRVHVAGIEKPEK